MKFLGAIFGILILLVFTVVCLSVIIVIIGATYENFKQGFQTMFPKKN